MRFMNINRAEIRHIIRIKHILGFIQGYHILLFKNLSISAKDLFSIIIILAIICNLIQEEKGQSLDSLVEKQTLFTEMRLYGLSYLYASLMLSCNITNQILNVELSTIRKFYEAMSTIHLINMNVADYKVTVLLKLIRKIIQTVTNCEILELSANFSRSLLVLKTKTSFRSIRLRQDNILQINILICTMKVLKLKANYLNLLYQFLVKGIKSIEDIYRIMSFLMSCRIVQSEQWFEA